MKLPHIRNETGQTVVEFAVILPLVVMVILALADFGRALYMYLEAEHAASDAARIAAVDYVPSGGVSLQNYLAQQLIYGELQNGSGSTSYGAQGKGQVCISFPAGGTPQRGDPVNVQVKSTFKWLPGGVLPTPSMQIVGSSTMRIENTGTGGVIDYSAGCST
jgi:hypothetical protein